jgi:hypothetical protein
MHNSHSPLIPEFSNTTYVKLTGLPGKRMEKPLPVTVGQPPQSREYVATFSRQLPQHYWGHGAKPNEAVQDLAKRLASGYHFAKHPEERSRNPQLNTLYELLKSYI